ncbi:flagellar FlbD family protein [Sutcliffiella deserti]|uniref:flagellar FlbD family protein n=1 Tax=Sutcliffiella deserti TaxID=2875501 RepID=UPI001CBD9CEF|nr:flagellar FlbD family protein [Sutcliffiella deserti]
MIILTKLNGKSFAVNPWLIEQVEEMPDTTISLNNGKKIIVIETMDEVIQRCNDFYTKIHQKTLGGEFNVSE